jgi:hypothetical protein
LLASVTQIRVFDVHTIVGASNDEEADATAFLADEFAVRNIAIERRRGRERERGRGRGEREEERGRGIAREES